MLNYGTIKDMNSSYYTGFFIINFFILYSHQNILTWFFGHFLEYALRFLNDNMDEGNK